MSMENNVKRSQHTVLWSSCTKNMEPFCFDYIDDFFKVIYCQICRNIQMTHLHQLCCYVISVTWMTMAVSKFPLYNCRYYDTNSNDIYLGYDQNMNESSVYYGTALAAFVRNKHCHILYKLNNLYKAIHIILCFFVNWHLYG